MASSSNNAQRLIGQTLPGRYRVYKAIGSGAFAWVYLAKDAAGTPVAVKVLQSSQRDSAEATTLFQREIKVLRALPKNNYCVQYLADGSTDDGTPFLVMEYIDGCTLKDALKFTPVWTVEDASSMMLQLCEALEGLHRLGLAHRDLKPDNVMLTRTWQVKLMDFGLVKDAQGLLKLFETEDILTGRDFAENVDKAMLAGTPEYMAPEQFSDPMVDESQARTDTWTDVFSLGLIYYQLLTGRKLFPFETEAQDQRAYARDLMAYIKSRTGTTDATLARPAEIPPALWTVLSRALRTDPRRRPLNGGDFAREIRKYLETGEAEEYGDEGNTFVANMSDLLAKLGDEQQAEIRASLRPPAAAAASRPAVSISTGAAREPGSGQMSLSRSGQMRVPSGPVVDVEKVQQYREQRLRAGKQTLLPGQLSAASLFGPETVQPSLRPPTSLADDASLVGPTSTGSFKPQPAVGAPPVPGGARPAPSPSPSSDMSLASGPVAVATSSKPQNRSSPAFWIGLVLGMLGIAVLAASAVVAMKR